jgi:hypothetical protein
MGRPREFVRRIPGIHLTKEQDQAIRAIERHYETTYAEALRHLLNRGIRASAETGAMKEAAPR